MAGNINKRLLNYLISPTSQTLIKKAITSAFRHGMVAREGVLNPGDCAFEAVINNINYHPILICDDHLTGEYRRLLKSSV